MKKETDYLKTQENWYILKWFKKKKHNIQMNRNRNQKKTLILILE